MNGWSSFLEQLSDFLLRAFMFFMLVEVFSLFPGWHLQLKGQLSSWCLKEDRPMMAVSSSHFPHPLALGELPSPSVPCLEGHILTWGVWQEGMS